MTPPPQATLHSDPPAGEDYPFVGVLVGTAVGDSLGLPMEGLSARRIAQRFPQPLGHRFLGRLGMVSDDTEHTLMLAQALLESPNDPEAFQRNLARSLRWWLVALPAGVGFATLRAILKLWLGVAPQRSGVWSAGNGPAMRCALLGVYFKEDREMCRAYVRASSEITHRDPRALLAAMAVAETASWMAGPESDPGPLLERLASEDASPEWTGLVERMRDSLSSGGSVRRFASEIGARDAVSGYAFESVPVAIYAALRHRGDYAVAISESIGCGGDTDTVAAIAGALVGTRVGVAGIPTEWRKGVVEFPCSLSFLTRVAERLALQRETDSPLGPVKYFWPAIPLRNLFFLAIVLAHGFRRLF